MAEADIGSGRLDQWHADLVHELHRIHRAGGAAVTVEVHLEVQVRPGRVTRRTGEADHRTRGDRLPDIDRWSGDHVAVAGHDAARVQNVDVPAAAVDGWAAVLVAAVRQTV